MTNRIQFRRDPSNIWLLSNPILSSGEIGFETDSNRIKIGDGFTPWTSLEYSLDIISLSANLTDYINNEIATILNFPPETLNTLEELADAINNDPNFFSNISQEILSASAYSLSEANDYTDIEIATLGIEVASASAQAVLEANFYTDSEIVNSINTASTAAVFESNNYTDTQLIDYLTQESASANYLTPNQIFQATNIPTQENIENKFLSTTEENTLWKKLSSKDIKRRVSEANIVDNEYTLQSLDSNSRIEMNSSGSNVLIVPEDSTTNFKIGTSVDIVQTGVGQTTISFAEDVSVNSKNSNNKISSQYGAATLYKRGTNEWILIGNIS